MQPTMMVTKLRDVVLAHLEVTTEDVMWTPIQTSARVHLERLTEHFGRSSLKRARRSWVLKYVQDPGIDETVVLDHLRNADVRAPAVPVDVWLRAEDRDSGVAVIAMEDLGPASRSRRAHLGHAAAVAIKIHNAVTMPLPELTTDRLAGLPESALMHLEDLQTENRWPDPQVRVLLQRLTAVAKDRAHDTDIPPYGLIHGTFDPTALLIDEHDQPRVLGLRGACIGPGLLDLAAWYGITAPARPDMLMNLIAAYIADGGTDHAIDDRAGLPPERWALGWYRVLACERIIELADLWESDSTHDAARTKTVIRLLDEAAQLLDA